MRFLVVGAGGIGGYFGGRLLAAGRDVTFLVRPGRAAQLARDGLVIVSPTGDAHLPAPPHLLQDALHESFDVVLLSCKAYDLDAAMASFAPAVGPDTVVLPLLNGMRHLDALDARFGPDRVMGGTCAISVTLDGDGRVVHLNDLHTVLLGERSGARRSRAEAIAKELSGAGFDLQASEVILQELWEKWVFIATAAGITCLLRARVGDLVEAGAADLACALLDECAAIAARQGFPPRKALLDRTRRMLTAPGSSFSTSMLRDLERGARIEADHILGDLLRRGAGVVDGHRSLLAIAFAHLKAYEARRAREGGA